MFATERTVWLACALIVALPMAAARGAPPGSGPVELRVPEGFAVDRAAGPPDVVFPMFGAFDDRGRLFVAESSGLDLYAELKASTRRCRVRLLEDRDGDGRFERSGVFAEGLTFPMGLAWREGKLYVADPPELVALEDRDGDGRAERRTMILTGFGHTDNGSLHGLVFGPDGRLYMTMGMPDGYTLDRGDGTSLSGTSGALIRCRPDGSRPEVVARGFVNLVEVAFSPRGEVFGTDNWWQAPSGGFRDALVHLVEGGLYPYAEDAGTPKPVTGDPLPPMARFPAVALSGLELYRGQALSTAWRGNLISAQHNARKVARHVLHPDGSTFRTEDFDLVTTDDPDFHPSDVIEDADGSLLLIDTGSWYVQHCPTGRIRNSPAPGGIYRVRAANAQPIADPWGQAIDWPGVSLERLGELLSDPRPAVCDRAQRALASKGSTAIRSLSLVLSRTTAAPEARVRAAWALATIADDSALMPLRDALGGDDPDVIATVARALAMHEDRRAEPRLRRLLGHGAPAVRLAAAEALAHCGGTESLSALWKALADGPDRFLDHALVHAAHRLADVHELRDALGHSSPRVQRAALILLDQPPRPADALRPELLVERIAAGDADLRRAALWVLRRHPGWADQAAGLVGRWVGKAALSDEERAGLRGVLLAFRRDRRVQDVVAEALAKETGTARLALLEAIAESPLPELPGSWTRALGAALADPAAEVREQAVRTAATLRVPELDAPLRRVAEDPRASAPLRLEALRAVLPRQGDVSPELFAWLVSLLDARTEPHSRLAAAALLGQARLSDAERRRVLDRIRGDALIAPEAFLPAAKAEALPARDLAQQRGRLAELEPLLKGGDPARGRAVFFGERVGCSACHQVGSEGRQVGPDLTRVGAVRSGRDLIESLVFPAATFAQGFENYLVATTDGRSLGGVIARQTDEVVVLRDASGAETRVPKRQIDELKRLDTSIMPEGLDRVLTPQELRDLLAYLQSLK